MSAPRGQIIHMEQSDTHLFREPSEFPNSLRRKQKDDF